MPGPAVDGRPARRGDRALRVTDDGIGMTADELPLALERHATSKLAHDEDLDAIATLGFRGEALAAICAVSRFTLTSCPRGGTSRGSAWPAKAGRSSSALEVPADAGTSVEVRDLFFNTPARLKFLKSSRRPSWPSSLRRADRSSRWRTPTPAARDQQRAGRPHGAGAPTCARASAPSGATTSPSGCSPSTAPSTASACAG